jgi:hypothetical protein
MNIQRKFFALLLAFTVGMGYASAQTSGLKTLYLKDGDIFVFDADGQPRQLTFDGVPKDFPLWSKDGRRIAFLRKIDKRVAQGNLVVVDQESGKKIGDFLICPTIPGVGYATRFIEGVEWLTEDRIAAAGSINPSNEETFVFDANTGTEVMDYPDDAGGAVFSPNGEHAASLTGKPHFASDLGSEPELNIDNHRIYPRKGIHVTFLSNPVWSEDSRSVAVVVEDYQSKEKNIVFCGLEDGCNSAILPPSTSNLDFRYQIQWSGELAYVTSPQGTWSSQREGKSASASLPLPTLKEVASRMTIGLRKQVQELGGTQPDFWCSTCALAKLPRQVPN